MSDQISSTSRFFPCQHFPRLWQSGAISGPIHSQMWCKCSIVVAPRFPRGCPAITRQSMGVWRQPRNGDWKIERFMKLDNFYFIAPCRNTNCDRILAIWDLIFWWKGREIIKFLPLSLSHGLPPLWRSLTEIWIFSWLGPTEPTEPALRGQLGNWIGKGAEITATRAKKITAIRIKSKK